MATVVEAFDETASDKGLSARRRGVVFASTIGTSLSLTQTFLGVFGIALVPISKDFGWSRTLVSGVMSLTFLKSLALAFAVGWLLDRFGPRRVLLTSLVLYAGALLMFAMAPDNVLVFYGLFALVCMFGAPTASTTFSKALAGWFDEGRGAVMGLAAGVGSGAGSALFPLLAGSLLPILGWRGVFASVAGIVLTLGVGAIFFLFHDPPLKRDDPRPLDMSEAAVGRGHTLSQALAEPTFWLLVASIGMSAGCMTAMFSMMAPVAQGEGFSLKQAVAAVTVFGIVGALAQWLIGALIDRFSRPLIMAPFYLVGALGLWLIHHGGGPPALFVAAALMGISVGAEYSALPLLLSRYFGVAHFGKIACLVYGVVALLTGLIPVGMNVVFDATGAYGPALTAIEIALLVATALILPLPSYRNRSSRDGRSKS